MTGSELDEILAESEQETVVEVQQQTESLARDEKGRFASRADEPEVIDETVSEHAEQPEAEPAKVPQQALHAAREKEREAKQENETLRQQLAQLQGQVELLSRQSRQPAEKTEEKKPAEFWEDPSGFVQTALTPVQQALQQQAELFSRRMAVKEHGADTVQSAYQALGVAIQSGDPSANAEFQRIRASDDPYEDIVQWHKRQETLKTVGSDPNVWLEAEMEKRLTDPAYQAKILEKIKGAAIANTNRSNPVTSLPPSLNRLPAGGNVADDSDASDAALFSFAMR